jgi:lysozyme
MRTSAKGRKFIETFEGLFLHAYNDGAGVCTIGYGHTDAAGPPSVHYGMSCAQTDADAWLSADLAKVERNVSTLVKVPLTQNEFDVLVSFDFNTGGLGHSTLLKKLNAGDYAGVPTELLKWDRAGGAVMKGLPRRRAAEGAMWSAPYTGAPTQPAPVPAPSLWSALAALLARIFGGSK